MKTYQVYNLLTRNVFTANKLYTTPHSVAVAYIKDHISNNFYGVNPSDLPLPILRFLKTGTARLYTIDYSKDSLECGPLPYKLPSSISMASIKCNAIYRHWYRNSTTMPLAFHYKDGKKDCTTVVFHHSNQKAKEDPNRKCGIIVSQFTKEADKTIQQTFQWSKSEVDF